MTLAELRERLDVHRQAALARVGPALELACTTGRQEDLDALESSRFRHARLETLGEELAYLHGLIAPPQKT